MNDEIKLIRSLLDYIEDYTRSHQNGDINGFSDFLQNKLSGNSTFYKVERLKQKFSKENYHNYKGYAEIEFSTLLTNLFKFARHYTKKVFQHSEIKTLDEFGFLATLLRVKKMLKKDLINRHLLETSSGSEILKRLTARKLIFETKCEEDKRAKWVSLTQQGQKAVMETFDEMHEVSEIIIGNLTKEEIEQSIKIFRKLELFHNEIHRTDKQSEIDTIYKKHISK